MDIVQLISNLDILSLVIGAFLGTIFSFWYNHFMTRPKLFVAGQGSGGGHGSGFFQNHVCIENRPGLMGFRLGRTTIFGKKILRNIEWGSPFYRSPAQECRASLYDKNTNDFIRPLYWRDPNNHDSITPSVTLNCGEKAELMLFCKLYNEKLKYFVYEPTDHNNIAPRVPDDEVKFNDTREFVIKINHSRYSKPILTFNVGVKRSLSGSLEFSAAGGSTSCG
ncbi:MAG: hypothetical protein SFX19_04515 [Alphaproteobacteria bacterium]|nr:hypothetical protein [Alphaproteobacteria bacterium]